MGIGAAIGGLAQGFAQGVKLKSDLEDAESRRGLQGLQMKQAQQQVDTGDEQAAARTEAANVIKGYATGDATLGFVRNDDGSYDPNRPENITRNYDLQAQSAARVALAHGQNPTKAIAEVEALRKQGFQEGVNRASALYGMGDIAGGDAALKQVYPMFRDNRTFLGSEINPNDPKQISLRYRDDKTGEEKSVAAPIDKLATQILPMAMNLTDAANYNLRTKEVGLKEREVDQKDTEIENLKSFRDQSLKLQGREIDMKGDYYKDLSKYHDQMGRAALARTAVDRDSVNLQRQTQALNNQLSSVTTLIGLDRNFDPNKADKAEIAAHKEKLATANTAMYLINQGISGGKLTIDATQALQLAQAADNVPFKDIQRAGPGMFFTNINGVKVPVGMSESQYNALSKVNGVTTAAPAAAPAAKPAGIKTPGNISVMETETREIERGLRTAYSPAARAEQQAAEKANAEAQAAAMRAEQERQIAASRGIAAQYRN